MKIFRKIIKFYQKHFPDIFKFHTFSENFDTTFVNVRFQFLFSSWIHQDAASLPDNQPTDWEKAGQNE